MYNKYIKSEGKTKMKNYKGMSRAELIKKIIDARVSQCKAENKKKFGDSLPRMNENRNQWFALYKTYPMVSKAQPQFSLVSEYERFYR